MSELDEKANRKIKAQKALIEAKDCLIDALKDQAIENKNHITLLKARVAKGEEEKRRLLRDPLVMPSECIKCKHFRKIDWLQVDEPKKSIKEYRSIARVKFSVEELNSICERNEEKRTVILRPTDKAPVVGDINSKYWEYAPSGKIEMRVLNIEAAETFELGKEYFVDFTPVDSTLD